MVSLFMVEKNASTIEAHPKQNIRVGMAKMVLKDRCTRKVQ